MNWFWVIGLSALLLAGLEFLRRRENLLGKGLKTRLKTFSARATVAFLLAFAIALPFASIEVSVLQRGIIIVAVLVVVTANFVEVDEKGA